MSAVWRATADQMREIRAKAASDAGLSPRQIYLTLGERIGTTKDGVETGYNELLLAGGVPIELIRPACRILGSHGDEWVWELERYGLSNNLRDTVKRSAA